MDYQEVPFSELPAARQEQALRRFQVLQPFLEGRAPLSQVVQEHDLALRTAWRWVQHYRMHGLAGLARAERGDRGKRRGIPFEMEQFISTLLQQEQGRSVAALYRRVLEAAAVYGWPTTSYSRVYAMARSLKEAGGLTMASAQRALEPGTHQQSFLEAKLRRPRLSSSLIVRERLFIRLDEGLSRALTVLSAPAGFGKTTLVGQWMAARQMRQQLPAVAWVSLESEDNDPLRFWRYVLVACWRLHHDATFAFEASEAVPPLPFSTLSTVEDALTLLLNAFSAAPESVLVLEDYHSISEPRIHQTMAFLLDHLPESLHVFLISRTDPPLSLAKLRADDNLCEVNASDLRFSLQEIRAFLQQATPFPLQEETIRQTNMRLDGWAAGLRLLSLSLREQASARDVEYVLGTFTGSYRPLQAYFVDEVLALQPLEVQHFLLCTSILGRLTAPLCNALTGREDGEQVLETLARGSFFVEALDESGRWYRYHALFAEAIALEARHRLGEDTLRRLAWQASLWFEQQEMLSQAVEMAFLSRNLQRTVALIECFIAVPYCKQLHEYHTLFRWLKQIPSAMLKQSPSLCLSYATTFLFSATTDWLNRSTLASIEEYLNEAEAGFSARGDLPGLGETLARRALLLWRQDALARAAHDARQALAWLPEREGPWRGICENILGVEALFYGQLSQAREIFQKTRALGKKLFIRPDSALPSWTWGKSMFMRTTWILLAWTCLRQGELGLAEEYYQQILAEAQEPADKPSHIQALLGSALIAYERNELDAAERLARESCNLARQFADETYQIRATLLQVRILQARGKSEEALKQLTHLRASSLPLSSALEREFLMEQATLYLEMGDLAGGERWKKWRAEKLTEQLLPFQEEQEKLLLARFSLAQGHIQQARQLLISLFKETAMGEQSRGGLELQVYLALTEAALQQNAEARQRLQKILPLLQREGYQRLLLNQGEAMARLLQDLASSPQEPQVKAYLRQLLQTFATPSAASSSELLYEQLSPQEVRVLRLLATGLSAAQIARQLIISVTTVRTHIQSIYRKLQVNNKVEASLAARSLNLLS